MADQIVFVESLASALESGSDGTYPVTLLTPGLGASAYYSEAVVKQYAPTAFPKGTHVYLTHERGAGGEPNPEKLLGTLLNETTIRESDGAAVNRFKPMKRWADFVEDVHQHVGLSICAGGSATLGMMEGKQVKIAESIDYSVANTVDMVSYPGRAGSGFVESAFARYSENVQPDPSAHGNPKNGIKMAEFDEKALSAFTESITKLVTLVESRLPEVETPAVDAEADRKSAIAATRIVESAEVSKDLKDKLIEGIADGNYEVEAAITEHKNLRESIKTELEANFRESGIVIGAQGSTGGGNAPVTVTGWVS